VNSCRREHRAPAKRRPAEVMPGLPEATPYPRAPAADARVYRLPETKVAYRHARNRFTESVLALAHSCYNAQAEPVARVRPAQDAKVLAVTILDRIGAP
jgi:hypothetical protein